MADSSTKKSVYSQPPVKRKPFKRQIFNRYSTFALKTINFNYHPIANPLKFYM